MSLAYLGTSEFAAGVLRRLDPLPELVVTRPDRPAGRGRRLSPPPVAEAARELGLALEQPDDVAALALDAFDDVVVCAFGALLREPLLSHPGLVNVHPSLLPRWRGAAPIERAIMAGDAETGVCIMRVVAELDAGPVCLRAVEPIRDDDDFGSLSARLVDVSAGLLRRWLAEGGECRAQGSEGMVYAEKIGPGDRVLDPARSPQDNARVVRALSPHIGAKAGELGVWRARPARVGGLEAADPSGGDGTQGGARTLDPGEVAVRDGRVLWGCAGGALELLEVQPPGKRRMPAADYARGR